MGTTCCSCYPSQYAIMTRISHVYDPCVPIAVSTPSTCSVKQPAISPTRTVAAAKTASKYFQPRSSAFSTNAITARTASRIHATAKAAIHRANTSGFLNPSSPAQISDVPTNMSFRSTNFKISNALTNISAQTDGFFKSSDTSINGRNSRNCSHKNLQEKISGPLPSMKFGKLQVLQSQDQQSRPPQTLNSQSLKSQFAESKQNLDNSKTLQLKSSAKLERLSDKCKIDSSNTDSSEHPSEIDSLTTGTAGLYSTGPRQSEGRLTQYNKLASDNKYVKQIRQPPLKLHKPRTAASGKNSPKCKKRNFCCAIG